MYEKTLSAQNTYGNDIKCISVTNNVHSDKGVPHRTSAVQQ